MKLAIIILSFNTKDLTRQCLDSLYHIQDYQAGQDFEIMVVDNGSQDGSIGMIKENFPGVKLIETGENLGFSKGNNVGANLLQSQTEYVLFLNPDTVMPDGTLSEMVNLMENNPEVGLSTCKVMLWSGGVDLDCHRGFPTPWTSLTRLVGLNKVFPKSQLFNRYNLGWLDLDTTHEIDVCVGAFMLVRRSAGELIDWWDEDYFLNGEDVDFCYRIKQAGYKILYHPDVEITHYRGASKGTRQESQSVTKASQEGKILVANSSVDAMEIFYRKHLRKNYSALVNWFVEQGIKILRLKRRLLTR